GFAVDDLFLHTAAVQAADWRRNLASDAGGGRTDPWRIGGIRPWAAVYGGEGGLAGNAAAGSGDLDYSGGGLAVGADYTQSNLMAGLDLGIDDSSFSVDGRAANGYVRGVHIGGYAALRGGGFYLQGLLQGDFFRDSVHRISQPVGVGEHLYGHVDGDGATGRIEAGYTIEGRWLAVTGIAAAQVSALHIDPYAEQTQAGPDLFALAYAPRDVQLPQSDLGLEFAPPAGGFATGLLGPGGLGSFHPYLRVEWRHSFEVARFVTPRFEFLPAAGPFQIFGAPAARDLAVIDAHADWDITRRLAAFASVGGQYSDGEHYTNADIGLRWRW
ncbi:MAG TPA: autotransporter outer membrane beta-barrel domain-containing protein, partial [Caulobacteraceae bacterium]|nr:autotransporter outer membrane beta-barrel domain-containing protein [Caulobacteraceae bacterium]